MRIIRAKYRSGTDFLRHYQPAFDGGGLFYPTRQALDEGTEVLVEIRLNNVPQRVMLRGIVIWHRPGRHSAKLRAGLGIEFDSRDAGRRDFVLAVARGEIDQVCRRHHRRVPVELQASWRISYSRAVHPGLVEDIGPGGAFVRVLAPRASSDSGAPGAPGAPGGAGRSDGDDRVHASDGIAARSGGGNSAAAPRFVVYPEPIAIGMDVLLDIVPPGSVSPLPIAGRVAWLDSAPGSPGFGMEFRARDAGGNRLLKELVRRLEAFEREAVLEDRPDGSDEPDDDDLPPIL